MMLDLSVSRDGDGELQVSGLPEGFFLERLDVQEPGGYIAMAGYSFQCDIRLALVEPADKNLLTGAFKSGDTQVRLSLHERVIHGQAKRMDYGSRRYGISEHFIDLHVVEN